MIIGALITTNFCTEFGPSLRLGFSTQRSRLVKAPFANKQLLKYKGPGVRGDHQTKPHAGQDEQRQTVKLDKFPSRVLVAVLAVLVAGSASTFFFILMLQARTEPDKTMPDKNHSVKDDVRAEEKKVRNRYMCPNAHVLKRTKTDGAFKCDICEALIEEGNGIMYCKKCDYCVCFTCHW